MRRWATAGPRAGLFDAAQWLVASSYCPLHALMAVPSLLFLISLTAMLFRPPDLPVYGLDRVAFLLLILVVVLRVFALGQPIRTSGLVTWPLLGLLLLSLVGALARPYEAQTWSVLAAKWLVPFALYHLAAFVFADAPSLKTLEVFGWIVLGYLSLIAVLFLFDAKSLIFPRFILDENLGIHTDRARGPFLQAVANGVTLNLLALLALDSFRRGRLPRIVALVLGVMVPLAIIATKTRAVWLSFAWSILALVFFSPSRRVRNACLALLLAGGTSVCTILATAGDYESLSDRLQETSPVEFRLALYRAGWEMFLEKPLMGWAARDIQAELDTRIREFHQEAFYFHNTFLETTVAYGLVGLGLYLWLLIDLFRLGRKHWAANSPDTAIPLLDDGFRSLWPILVCVYVFNACFVVMNYQFVNGFFFTVAGILAAPRRQQEL